jgi:hypothetical protein
MEIFSSERNNVWGLPQNNVGGRNEKWAIQNWGHIDKCGVDAELLYYFLYLGILTFSIIKKEFKKYDSLEVL